MANNKLTAKEVTLKYEESACKKARLYSRTLTDPVISETFGKIADHHEKRFEALLNLL